MVKKLHVRHFFDETYMKEKLINFKIIKIEKTKGMYEGLQGEKTSHFIEAIATKNEPHHSPNFF